MCTATPSRWRGRFCELGATDEQTDFDICYASAIKGMSGPEPATVVDGLVRRRLGHKGLVVRFVCVCARAAFEISARAAVRRLSQMFHKCVRCLFRTCACPF
jgi:hypothetical protein